MFRFLLTTLLVATVAVCAAQASPANTKWARLQGAALLHQREPMSFGVYYYPQQWPRKQGQCDFNCIAGLGFDFAHMAEFSWTYLEPTQGHFDFSWLDHAIAEASKAGLRVVLGKPSAAPPSWMSHCPQVYRVDEHGQRHQFGICVEVSLANPTYEDLVAKVVTAMAKHYDHDPRVWGSR